MLPLLLLLAVDLTPGGDTPEFHQPQLAAAHGQVAITYGAGSAIYFALSGDGGHAFSRPVKVADTGALALGRHRGPRVIVLSDAIVISAVAGRGVSKETHAHGLPEKRRSDRLAFHGSRHNMVARDCDQRCSGCSKRRTARHRGRSER